MIECTALQISVVTEADVAKAVTQDQGPSKIAFNSQGRFKNMFATLDKALDKNNYDMLDFKSSAKKNARYLCRPEKDKAKKKLSDNQAPSQIGLHLGAKMLLIRLRQHWSKDRIQNHFKSKKKRENYFLLQICGH